MANKTSTSNASASNPEKKRSFPNWVSQAATAGLVLVLAILYYMDSIKENVGGFLLAAVLAISVTWYVSRELLQASKTALDTGLSIACSIALLAIAAGPAYLTTLPGTPLAEGQLKTVGDSIHLPDNAHGNVRLLVHGALAHQGESVVSFTLEGTVEPVVGRLERNVSQARAGKRGYTTVTHEWNTEYLSGVVPAGIKAIKLSAIEGPLKDALHVSIYTEYWPRLYQFIVAIIALLLITWLATRLKLDSSVDAFAGLGLGFGIMVYVYATPDSAVRPTIGAVIVGGIIGMIGGGIASFIMKRLIPPEQPKKSTPKPT